MSVPTPSLAGEIIWPFSSKIFLPESSSPSAMALRTPIVTSSNGASTVVGASPRTIKRYSPSLFSIRIALVVVEPQSVATMTLISSGFKPFIIFLIWRETYRACSFEFWELKLPKLRHLIYALAAHFTNTIWLAPSPRRGGMGRGYLPLSPGKDAELMSILMRLFMYQNTPNVTILLFQTILNIMPDLMRLFDRQVSIHDDVQVHEVVKTHLPDQTF